VFYNAHSNKLEDIAIIEPDNQRLQLYAIGVDITDVFNNK